MVHWVLPVGQKPNSQPTHCSWKIEMVSCSCVISSKTPKTLFLTADFWQGRTSWSKMLGMSKRQRCCSIYFVVCWCLCFLTFVVTCLDQFDWSLMLVRTCYICLYMCLFFHVDLCLFLFSSSVYNCFVSSIIYLFMALYESMSVICILYTNNISVSRLSRYLDTSRGRGRCHTYHTCTYWSCSIIILHLHRPPIPALNSFGLG